MDTKLTKILILSYFFPPANFAGSYRIYSWAKYLNRFGYYPIIITRNWENNISTLKDMSKITSREIIFRKEEGYEVYYMPYKGNWRDRLYNKYEDNSFVILRRILTFFELVLQNFCNLVIPFRNIYTQAKQVIEKERDIQLIIASGKPFVLFKFCYMLNKKYKIKWLADYRDEWNTHQITGSHLISPQRIISVLENYFEKKWVSTSESILSVSDFLMRRISDFVSKQGFVIMNGYDEDDYISINSSTLKDTNNFTIVYNGTLYGTQQIEFFLNGVKKIIEKYANTINIKIYFPGLTIDAKQAQNVRKNMENYLQNIIVSGRIKKEEVITLQFQANALLMVAHTGIKGTYSSKIFEYLACKRPIILCPSDNDVLERIIKETNSGFVCNNALEVEDLLDRMVNEFINKKIITIKPNIEAISKYTRKRQTEMLAGIIGDLFLTEDGLTEKIFIKTRLRNFIFKTFYTFRLDKLFLRKYTISQSVIIACFHRVSYETDYSYPPIKPSHFKRLIEYIVKYFEVIPLSDISKTATNIKPRIVLSFDDGYMDFKENVLPVLKMYNLPSVCSVITSCLGTGESLWTQHLNNILNAIYHLNTYYTFSIGNEQITYDRDKSKPELISNSIFYILLNLSKKDRENFIISLEKQIKNISISKVKMMQWADIKYCLKNKVELASHSISHDSLITIHNEQELKKEIIESKNILEKELSMPVLYFTFPNGLYNDHICRIAREAGYKYLLASEEEFTEQNNINANFIFPRITMDKKTWQENVFKLHNFHKLF